MKKSWTPGNTTMDIWFRWGRFIERLENNSAEKEKAFQLFKKHNITLNDFLCLLEDRSTTGADLLEILGWEGAHNLVQTIRIINPKPYENPQILIQNQYNEMYNKIHFMLYTLFEDKKTENSAIKWWDFLENGKIDFRYFLNGAVIQKLNEVFESEYSNSIDFLNMLNEPVNSGPVDYIRFSNVSHLPWAQKFMEKEAKKYEREYITNRVNLDLVGTEPIEIFTLKLYGPIFNELQKKYQEKGFLLKKYEIQKKSELATYTLHYMSIERIAWMQTLSITNSIIIP